MHTQRKAVAIATLKDYISVKLKDYTVINYFSLFTVVGLKLPHTI